MTTNHSTPSGLAFEVQIDALPYEGAIDPLMSAIDERHGVILTSGHEAPGRYARWDLGFVDPPLLFTGRGRDFKLQALNPRGEVLLDALDFALSGHKDLRDFARTPAELTGSVVAADFTNLREEERLRAPTLLTVVRALRDALASGDEHLGLYGAFGYDLALQFEPIVLKHERGGSMRDVHLYIPDELVVVDHRREKAERRRYDFVFNGRKTAGIARTGAHVPIARRDSDTNRPLTADLSAEEYGVAVERIRQGCKVGDFFEVVPSRVFQTGFSGSPGELFHVVRTTNPSPYAFCLNLGDQALIGASPEMYVRVEGERVETCPISGTISRGRDAMEDAERIKRLLTSAKEESELTMCTDVDRNDKARVCKPGSVRVEGRRIIETYSRLFHTVDYVTGILRDDCDALDAFAAHMWACTLTGAPKPAAMAMVEQLERSPREWYGGAIGLLRFDGSINTGITIRTIRLREGTAELRVGATVLYDSVPAEEEIETRVKAEAFLDAVAGVKRDAEGVRPPPPTGHGKKVLFVDNNDSFVHTLADYVRQTGAEVVTYRAGFSLDILDREKPDLVFVSPGPGRPEEFSVPTLVRACVDRALPVFGVCLGLQGMVEAFGGELGVLPEPKHGKPSAIRNERKGVFAGFPESFTAGRYHSLYAIEAKLPDCLEITARSEDGTIMAVGHKELPLAAVQFHPESILTLGDRLGHRLIANVLDGLKAKV